MIARVRTSLLPSVGLPLRAVQAAACAAVVAVGLNASLHSPSVPSLRHSPTFIAPPLNPLRVLAGSNLARLEIVVQRNDTLDSIFRRLQLSVSDLADLRTHQPIRALLDRLSPGERLLLTHRQGTLVSLERQVSLTQTLKVQRTGEGFQTALVQQPVNNVATLAHGTIDSSLFEAGAAAGLSDATVLKLSKIFGTDVDFVLGLRRGDQFLVNYERVVRDGHVIKDGDILAARFVNQGRVYEAVRYVGADGEARYYTPDGHTMEKAFLRAPLEFKRISSTFSLARRHPILNRIRAHKGVDFAAPTGTPVYAAGNGRILFRGRKGGFGNLVEIDHGGGIVTVYGHLSRFGQIAIGSQVHQGETIGFVGMTGLATGPHLHYEFHVNGQYVDPQTVKLAQPLPLDAAHRADFAARTAPLLAALTPTPAAQLARTTSLGSGTR